MNGIDDDAVQHHSPEPEETTSMWRARNRTRAYRRLSLTSEALFLILLLALLCVRCGVGSFHDDCEPGDLCACRGIGDCSYHCLGGDCHFVCDGVGQCDLFCDGGGCTAYLEGTGDATLECEGGGCSVFAAGMGNRTLYCPGDDCDMTCNGIGTCEIVGCDRGCDLSCAGIGHCF